MCELAGHQFENIIIKEAANEIQESVWREVSVYDDEAGRGLSQIKNAGLYITDDLMSSLINKEGKSGA